MFALVRIASVFYIFLKFSVYGDALLFCLDYVDFLIVVFFESWVICGLDTYEIGHQENRWGGSQGC